jgi:hypothetical protein
MPLNRAKFSPDRRFRYWLVFPDHEILANGKTLAVIGLNPSKADEHQDDPTITRCKRWASQLGFARLLMLNVYAWCATDSRDLWAAHYRGIDIAGGPENYPASLLAYCREFQVSRIIAAWGRDRIKQAHKLQVDPRFRFDCFRQNKDGSPHHPLYLSYSLKPQPWNYTN